MNTSDQATVSDYSWEPPRKRNPLVMAGALITAGVLIGGLVAFKQGKQQLSQQMMRARIIAQGGTVALMLGSSGYYALNSEKSS